MLPEISIINSYICDFESKYGVTFCRSTSAISESNGLKCLHILANEWVNEFVAPNKKAISLIAVVDPISNNFGIAMVVLNISPTAFIGYEIWDLNSNVIASGPVFPRPPYPSLQGFRLTIEPTVKNVTVTPEGNKFRVHGTVDLEILGVKKIDLFDFDVFIEIKIS